MAKDPYAAKRGPKAKTAAHSPALAGGGLDWSEIRAPEDLTPEAREEFDRLVNALRSIGTLERTDLRLVEMTARLAVTIRDAYRQIDRDGLVVEASNKTLMNHPAWNVINSSVMRLKAMLNDMGLTPASSKLADASAASSDDMVDDPIASIVKFG